MRPFAALSRITLEVDARTSPREVQRIYSGARTRLQKGRDHEISAKHAALAIFAAEQGLRATGAPAIAVLSVQPLDGLTGGKTQMRIAADLFRVEPPSTQEPKGWLGMLKIWNARFPDWAYTKSHRVNDFARDVRAAWERITECSWAPPKDAEDAADVGGGES